MITITRNKKIYKIKLKITKKKLSIPKYIKIQNELLSMLEDLKREAIKNDIRKFISEKQK